MSHQVSQLEEQSVPAKHRNGVWELATACVIIACLWCVVLPWFADRPAMKAHLQFLDDRGIDPSAMFYTELDAMDAILEKLESDR